MNQERKFSFSLSEEEANLVIQALAELPSKVSMNLILNLQSQYRQQQIPMSVAPQLVPAQEKIDTNIIDQTGEQ